MPKSGTSSIKHPNGELSQPARESPFLPKEWLHRYYRIRLTSDKESILLPCNSANFFIADINPRWYVDKMIETWGNTLFILYLDTTNTCGDRCKMCFTEQIRREQGLGASLDVDLALKRIEQLRQRYPTFKMISLAGPGEPLEYKPLTKLCPAVADMGLSFRVYTSGRKLKDSGIRETLLSSVNLIRISLDAADTATFQKTHGAKDFSSRVDNIRRLVEDRNRTGSGLSIGLHFVIQKENFDEIVDFAYLAKDLQVDFVVYGQETFSKVHGGFSESECEGVLADLDRVKNLHSEEMAVVVPQNVHRHTYFEFDRNHFASPELLNSCYNCKNKIYFGIKNDFAGCWLATMRTHFYEQAYVGPLSNDAVFFSICGIIDNGLGSYLNQGAYLACNSCFAENYNALARGVLSFARGKSAIDTHLIEYVPDSHSENFEIVLGQAK